MTWAKFVIFYLTNWLLFLTCLYLKSMQPAASQPFQNVASVLIFFPCLLSWHIARIPYKPSSFLPLATAFWRPLLLAGLSFHLFPPGYEGSWWTELTKFTLLFPLSFSWSTNYWHVIRHLTRGLLYHGWHDRLLSSRTFSSLSVVLRTPLSPSVCHSEPQLLYLAGLLL